MGNLLDKLPTILILTALVGTFLSLQRHAPSVRTRLWGIAWGLIFVHFFVQALDVQGEGFLERTTQAVNLIALELSGVVFLVSLTDTVERRLFRWRTLLILGLGAGIHAGGVLFDWKDNAALAAALGLFFGGALFFLLLSGARLAFKLFVGTLFAGSGVWAIVAQLHGNPQPGITIILTVTFAICGVLYWRRYPRYSIGVLSVVGGFLAWGGVFPLAWWIGLHAPQIQLNPEIWNVPKYFVAFGMILTLLEDKTKTIEEGHVRERAENALLARFARVTSQLLTGKDPLGLSADIAKAITEVVSFQRAAIIVTNENGLLFVAGAYGYGEREEERLRQRASRNTLSTLDSMRSLGRPVCGKAFRFGWVEQSIAIGDTGNNDTAQIGGEWIVGEDLIVPLTARQGSDLGWIVLSEPTCKTYSLLPQIVRLELLAADLAAQIENTRLQRQLVRSEKLAGIGQLVAGVAHELNNPLTGIIGYSDILKEEVKQESVLRRLGKMGEEARRMKRIVDSLLRFSRSSHSSVRSSLLGPALQDALQLREYFVRSKNIEIRTTIAPMLPPLAIDDDELKQILLNLLSNAIDAVEDCESRCIDITARATNERVVIHFEDSGPGFTNLHRAFDPFFTTKPVGKGTGLGLSICYGLLKNCGGEIHVSNREPHGASVVLSIPIAAAGVESLETQTA